MDLGLRARVAAAMLELAFNPHQRRGPDGRWIKMQTSELKRPRRPKKAKPSPAKPKASRPEVKATSNVPATRLTPRDEPVEEMRERLARAQKMNAAMFGEQRSRWPAEERAGVALLEAAIDGRLSRDSERPQVLIADDAARYRAERDEYNAEVMAYAAAAQARAQERWGKPDEALQIYIDSVTDAIRDDDVPGLVDENIDYLREELDRDYDARGALPFKPTGDEARALPLLPPGPRTSGGDRPPGTARYEDRRVALDHSIRSGIADQDLIGGGAMGDTRRIILADGTDAIYKRARGDWYGWSAKEQADAEELGALVAAAVGVRAPAIQRVDDTTLYMEVMPGAIAARRGMGRAPQSITDSPQGMRMGLLDVLLNNHDRHAGNWMVDPDNQIAAIDHGLAFRDDNVEKSEAASPFVSQFVDIYDGSYLDANPLTARDVEQVRSDLERIRPRFEELGRDDWFTQVDLRLERLARRASGYRPLLEDAPAMFARRVAVARAMLAARTATAQLELAFNPHQRRGPDGRWIKMPTSELKRPRSRKPRAAAAAPAVGPGGHELRAGGPVPIVMGDELTQWRAARDQHNARVIARAQAQADKPVVGAPKDADLSRYLQMTKNTPPGEHRDGEVDRLRRHLDKRYGSDGDAPPPRPVALTPPAVPSGERTVGGPRPGLDAPYEQRRAALDASVRSGIVGQEGLGGGKMGDTRRVQLADGSEAIYKTALQTSQARQQADSEELSALLAGELGVRAPAVQRAGTDAIYMEVMPGVPAAEKIAGRRSAPGSVPGRRMGVLDVLIDNYDRHDGNWMLDDRRQISAIDHGQAFTAPYQRGRTAAKSAFTEPYAVREGALGVPLLDSNPLSTSDIARLRAGVDALRERFVARGREQWWQGMSQRLDDLAARATGTESFLYPEGA